MINSFDGYDKILEATFFDNQESVDSYVHANSIENNPIFKIGDIVYHIDEDLKIYNSTPNCEYTNEMLFNTKDFTGIPLTVIGKFKGNKESDYPWWSNVRYTINNNTDSLFIIDVALSYKKTKEPNYKPKRIERTFESISGETEYRFKTEEEFYNEFGPEWREDIYWTYDNDMDYLFGQPFYGEVPASFDEDVYTRIPNTTSGNRGRYWCVYLNHLKKIEPKIPNYNPKRIERTFEKNNTYDTAHEFFVLMKSEFENKTILDLLKPFNYHISENIYNFEDFPILIFINIKFKTVSHSSIENMSPYFRSQLSNHSAFDGCWDRQLTFDDLDLIKTIIKDQKVKIVPSYKPKSIIRESVEIKYVIKTEEEFKQEYGQYWENKVNWNRSGHMDYLFGQPVDITNKDYLGHTIIENENPETTREFWIINKLMLKQIIEPSYKPKKIERTFESNSFKYKHDFIFIHATSKYENVAIQNELFKCGFKWNSQLKFHKGLLLYENQSDIIITLELITKGICKFDNVSSFQNIGLNHPTLFLNQDKKLYNYSDLEYILCNILKNRPNYSPKRIERTLESTKWYPYRFKTIDEFIKDYGRFNWRSAHHNSVIGFIEIMDYLLGQDYPFDVNIDDYGFDVDLPNLPCPTSITPRGFWTVRKFMLTPNEKIPDYKPRKIERTFESVEDSKFTSVVFIANNDEECKIVQEELLKRKYSWEVSGEERIVRYFSNEYPIYLFAEIDSDKISYMGENDTKRYYGGIEKYISECNDDGENICLTFFKYNDAKYFDSIIKSGKVEPSYRPKKIERTFESLKKYKYACIEANGRDEIVTIQKELFKNGYTWTISGQEIKHTNRDYILICPEMDGKNMGYLEDEIEFNERKDILNMYDKIFKYSELYNFIRFLKDGIEKPNYEPKKIERTLESRNDNKTAREIYLKLNNKSEVETLKDALISIDYIIPSFIKNNQTPSFSFPIYIFIDFIDRDIMYITSPEKTFDFEKESMFNGVWDKQLTIKDITTIKYILVNKKIMEVPSYNPKRIIRESKVFETFNDKYPYNTVIFTIKSVSELMELKGYFLDKFNKDITGSNINTMTSYLSRTPLYVRCNYNKFNDGLTYFYGSMNNLSGNVYKDEYEKLFDITDIRRDVIKLIINTGSSDRVPSYSPKRIERTLENYQFINDNDELDKCKFPKPKFRIGDKVIFKEDALEIYENKRKSYIIEERKINNIRLYLSMKKELEIVDMAFEDSKGYWLICLEDDDYYYDDMLEYKRPSYKPKKIIRTL